MFRRCLDTITNVTLAYINQQTLWTECCFGSGHEAFERNVYISYTHTFRVTVVVPAFFPTSNLTLQPSLLIQDSQCLCLSILDMCLLITSSKHYIIVIMSVMACQITGVSIVCLTVSSGVDQRKHHSCASVASVKGIKQREKCFPVMKSSSAEFIEDHIYMAGDRWIPRTNGQ